MEQSDLQDRPIRKNLHRNQKLRFHVPKWMQAYSQSGPSLALKALGCLLPGVFFFCRVIFYFTLTHRERQTVRACRVWLGLLLFWTVSLILKSWGLSHFLVPAWRAESVSGSECVCGKKDRIVRIRRPSEEMRERWRKGCEEWWNEIKW